MDKIVDIGLPTIIASLGIFFAVFIVDYVMNKVWSSTPNQKVRQAIKWIWLMWTPLWPIVFGGLGGLMKGLPMPAMITALGPVPGLPSVVYGAFCGMISMSVVKAIKQALEKKGIDVTIPHLGEAEIAVKQGIIDAKAEKIKSGKASSVPPPPQDSPQSESSPAPAPEPSKDQPDPDLPQDPPAV